MRFIADLHIHSHFSVATSKDLTPEHLDYWARLKGITVVGTGDFTHPGWITELREKLEPAKPGLFKLKDDLKLKLPFSGSALENQPVRFMLTAEISSIYKKSGKVRKVHNVLFAPDFETVEKIQQALGRIGNITSDGRPILGLDSRDLLEIALEANPDIFFLPAHVWTPWFSALGSKSGFDSIDECFADLSGYIYAVETGLSTDPAMNWMCSFLDRFTLMSNSDAHSPEKLGRNANIFDCELSYPAMTEAIKTGGSGKFVGTIDMFPQEGKYHYDGHRKCGVRWDPVQTLEHSGVCPVCGKKVTVGVMHRVVELSDRDDLLERPNRLPFYSIIPLKEILSEITGVGVNSKQVNRLYLQLLQNIGSEFDILLHLPQDALKAKTDPVLAEAIRRMRNKEVHIQEGFDGEFGRITVFAPQERSSREGQENLFASMAAEPEMVYRAKRGLINFSLKDYHRLKTQMKSAEPQPQAAPVVHSEKETSPVLRGLNDEQRRAVLHHDGPALVIAGPGAGKTRVLTSRIAHLITERDIPPQHILAVTFTNQAADEMKSRLSSLLSGNSENEKVHVMTFHRLGLFILQNFSAPTEAFDQFSIIDEEDRRFIFKELLGKDAKTAAGLSAAVAEIKQKCLPSVEIGDPELKEIFTRYQQVLNENQLWDIEDLIYRPVLIMQADQEVRCNVRDQFRWALVDEYQDVNQAQYRLLRLLYPEAQSNLFVIGDPNQAIYGFRGAQVGYIRRFKEDYPQAITYRLKKSYRCSQNILNASADILSASDSTLEALEQGVKIRIVNEATEKSEAEFVARTIEQMMGGVHFFSMDSGISAGQKSGAIESFSDFAILCRTTHLMPAVEKALNDHRLPYQRIGTESLFKDKQIKNVLTIFDLVVGRSNGVLVKKMKITGLSKEWLQNLRAQLSQRGSVQDKLRLILSALPDGQKPAKRWQELLLYAAERFTQDVDGFRRFARLGSGSDFYDPRVEKISLMTMHAAKGLEFNCVFVVGLEDQILPYALFKERPDDPAEEERLLYVAMTRARQYLFLSHVKRRFLKGREWHLEPSPFLSRIERTLTEFEQSTRKRKPRKDDNQLSLFD